MSDGERWLANHAVTELWSGWDDRAIAWTIVPQWSVFQQVGPQQEKRIHVHYYGNSTSEEGDVWVDAEDLGPIGKPPKVVEPEWPRANGSPEPKPHDDDEIEVVSRAAASHHFRSAPPIPADQVPHIVAAARAAEVDPALLAATAAAESSFGPKAYREERQLPFVLWRPAPAQPADRFPDGSLGCCQILRSNLRAFAIDNDGDACDVANNFRVGARIIRQNTDAFPKDPWKAIAAYNVGQYGARQGRIPANDYVDRILQWAEEYRELFEQHGAGQGDGTQPQPDAAPQPAGLVSKLIEYGYTLIGTPYVFGAKYKQISKGLDCSGFVCEVLEHCGVRLGDRNYLSAEALRQKTDPVREAELRPGDLVFFEGTYDTPGASHIGFCLGGGKMLDATGRGGVRVDSLDDPYWRQHLLGFGRLDQVAVAGPPAPRPLVPTPPAPTMPESATTPAPSLAARQE